MFSYAQLEAILAKLHASEAWQVSAFRARLKHLKRLGIPLGANPGKGKRVEYTKEHLYQWVFCLECAQLGFEPTWAVDAVKQHWKGIHGKFKSAERAPNDNDLFMVMTPQFMTVSWTKPNKPQSGFILPDTKFEFWDDLQTTLASISNDHRRVCLLNLSKTVRDVASAERELAAAG